MQTDIRITRLIVDECYSEDSTVVNEMYPKEGNTVDNKILSVESASYVSTKSIVIQEWELVPTLEDMLYWDKLNSRNWLQKLIGLSV